MPNILSAQQAAPLPVSPSKLGPEGTVLEQKELMAALPAEDSRSTNASESTGVVGG
jgi:hypothetical protein